MPVSLLHHSHSDASFPSTYHSRCLALSPLAGLTSAPGRDAGPEGDGQTGPLPGAQQLVARLAGEATHGGVPEVVRRAHHVTVLGRRKCGTRLY